jgi:hypothetical protein
MPATSKQDRSGWEASRKCGKGAVQTVLNNQFQGDGKSRAPSIEEIHPTHHLGRGETREGGLRSEVNKMHVRKAQFHNHTARAAANHYTSPLIPNA